YKCQTKWRASGRFRMDLTARDPSKVPRCILSGTAGVSEAIAEREPAAEILSEPNLHAFPHCLIRKHRQNSVITGQVVGDCLLPLKWVQQSYTPADFSCMVHRPVSKMLIVCP